MQPPGDPDFWFYVLDPLAVVTWQRTSASNRYFLAFYAYADWSGTKIQSSWRNRVHVYSHFGGSYEGTKHIIGLSAGGSWSGTSAGNAFTISIDAIGTNSATFSLTLPNAECRTSTASPSYPGQTLSPTPGPTPSPTPSPVTPAPTMDLNRGAIACGETVNGNTNNPGVSLRGNAAFDHYYTFNVQDDGTKFTFDSCTTSFDSWLRVFDANWNEVAGCDDCGSCGTQTILDTVLDAGDYHLLVEGWSASSGADIHRHHAGHKRRLPGANPAAYPGPDLGPDPYTVADCRPNFRLLYRPVPVYRGGLLGVV